jgi:hypothetical protein
VGYVASTRYSRAHWRYVGARRVFVVRMPHVWLMRGSAKAPRLVAGCPLRYGLLYNLPNEPRRKLALGLWSEWE